MTWALLLGLGDRFARLHFDLGDTLRVLRLSLVRYTVHLLAHGVEGGLPDLFVHGDDDELGEVEHPLQAARRDVQQQPDAAGRALDEPYVRHRGCQFDVAHALSPDLGPRHLYAALIAHNALVADALVLTAVALEVLGGPEYLLAEQPVLLRLQRPVVDGLRLHDLSVRPRPHLLRRGQRYADGVEVVNFECQGNPLPSQSYSSQCPVPASPAPTCRPGSPSPPLR